MNKSLKITTLTLITLIFAATALDCWWGWGPRRRGRPYRRRPALSLDLLLGSGLKSSESKKIDDIRRDLNNVIKAINELAAKDQDITKRINDIEEDIKELQS